MAKIILLLVPLPKTFPVQPVPCVNIEGELKLKFDSKDIEPVNE